MTIQQTEDELLVPMYTKREIALVRGEGYYLWDSDGKRYTDFGSNYGVNILGHSNPAVTRALCEQAGTLLSCHQSFYNDVRAAYLEKLRSILPAELSRVFFSNSGTESVEAALKFARAATGRGTILSAKRGYHGRTFGSLSATAGKKYRDPYMPVLSGFQHVGYGDTAELEAALTPDVAAVILEPVQGEAGVYLAPEGYLEAVAEMARANGTLVILDEVQTGFRTGRYFAFQHTGMVPDILCVSKGVANGVPMGLTITSEQVSSQLPPGSHGNTFGASPLVCAAGLAVLEEIERGKLLEHSAEVGAYLRERLNGLDRIREVRGVGVMVAVDLRERATRYLRGLQERGFIGITAGPTALRFLPPLIIDREAVDALVETLAELLAPAGAAS